MVAGKLANAGLRSLSLSGSASSREPVVRLVREMVGKKGGTIVLLGMRC
jgi:hypothetical protein